MSDVLHLSICSIDLDASSARRYDREPLPLLPLEVRLMRYLAAQRGRVVPREELLTEVWRVDPATRTRTIDMTVRRLRKKIERDPRRPEHLMTAAGSGYRLVGPHPPVQHDAPIVGREDLIGALLASWCDGPVCLVGSPGVGKTHVAREVARRCPLPGGAWVCEAHGAATRIDLVVRIAEVLGLQLADAEPEAQFLRAVEGRAPMLLVLDGCEAAPAVAEAVERWRVRGLALMLTSRVTIAGARPIRVPPLDSDSATALFALHARRVHDRFRIGPSNEAAVRTLVAALDHLPLAIVLAAGRASAMSPSGMVRRLSERMRLLDGANRAAGPRHHSLTVALRGSWDALDSPSRETLAALTVFRKGCSPEAAQRVLPHPDTLEGLWRGSLVQRDGGRVWLLDSIRDFVAAQPELRSEISRAERRHARWCAELPEAWDWAEHPNLAAAFERSVGWREGALAGTLALGLIRHFRHRGPWTAGVACVERALALVDAQASGAAASLTLRLEAALLGLRCALAEDIDRVDLASLRQRAESLEDGDDAARVLAAVARALVTRSSGDPEAEAVALRAVECATTAEVRWRATHVVSAYYNKQGRFHDAMTWAAQALALAEEAGSEEGRFASSGAIGQIARELGLLDLAREHLEPVVSWLEGWGADRSAAILRRDLGLMELERGRFDEARGHVSGAVALLRRAGDPRQALSVEVSLATIDHQEGRDGAARDRLRDLLPTLEAHLSPNLGFALALLGRICTRQGDFESATRAFDRAEHASRRNMPAVRFQLAVERMNLLRAMGDLAAARARMQEAEAWLPQVETGTERAEFRAHQGLLLLEDGGDAEAALAAAEAEAVEVGGLPPQVERALDALREAIRRGLQPNVTS